MFTKTFSICYGSTYKGVRANELTYSIEGVQLDLDEFQDVLDRTIDHKFIIQANDPKLETLFPWADVDNLLKFSYETEFGIEKYEKILFFSVNLDGKEKGSMYDLHDGVVILHPKGTELSINDVYDLFYDLMVFYIREFLGYTDFVKIRLTLRNTNTNEEFTKAS